MTYGKTREEAISKVKALALRVLADRVEHGEELSELDKVFAVSAWVDDHLPKRVWCWLPCCESDDP